MTEDCPREASVGVDAGAMAGEPDDAAGKRRGGGRKGQRKFIWPARDTRGGANGPGRNRRTPVRWSDALAVRLLERLAAGELLYRIVEEPGMPTPEGIAKWAREKPEFGAALLAARREGGRPAGSRGPVSTYCPAAAHEVFERLCEGQSLTAVGRDPTMPSVSTLMNWRKRHNDFEALMQLGMRIRAERMCDDSWDMAMAATPETAYLTQVRLAHLRWLAGVMAPRTFRLKMMEPETPPPTRTILMRHFEVEVDEATGKKTVVAYCPNPFTREVEREDTPGWRPPGDEDVIPMPGGRCGR